MNLQPRLNRHPESFATSTSFSICVLGESEDRASQSLVSQELDSPSRPSRSLETRSRRSFFGLSLAVAALGILLGTSSAHAQEATVEATGEAAIVGKDRAQAVERATEDALRKAVEQSVGTLVQSTTDTKDFMLVQDRILTQARGYVKRYEEIERKEDGGAMVVKIRAVVGTEQLEGDLAAIGLALVRKGMPRVAVLISEQQIGQSAPTTWLDGDEKVQGKAGPVLGIDQRLAENTLMQEWQKKGFSFVDLQALSGKLKLSGPVSGAAGSQAVQEIANLSDADVIILGSAVATKAGDVSGFMNQGPNDPAMVSCKAVISVRAFNADNGEILAAAEISKTRLNIETFACGRDALVKGSAELAEDLQRKLLSKWNTELGGSLRLRMKVVGIDSYSTLSSFRNFLTNGTIRGVQSVDQKSFKDGQADLDVRMKGSSEDLASELSSKLDGKLKVEIKGLTANTIEVSLSR